MKTIHAAVGALAAPLFLLTSLPANAQLTPEQELRLSLESGRVYGLYMCQMVDELRQPNKESVIRGAYVRYNQTAEPIAPGFLTYLQSLPDSHQLPTTFFTGMDSELTRHCPSYYDLPTN